MLPMRSWCNGLAGGLRPSSASLAAAGERRGSLWGSAGSCVRREYKVPRGKLVAADFEVRDGRLSGVAIDDDFPREPPDALEALDDALEGVSMVFPELEGAPSGA